jgi:hypothetical protein
MRPPSGYPPDKLEKATPAAPQQAEALSRL